MTLALLQSVAEKSDAMWVTCLMLQTTTWAKQDARVDYALMAGTMLAIIVSRMARSQWAARRVRAL